MGEVSINLPFALYIIATPCHVPWLSSIHSQTQGINTASYADTKALY